MMTQDTITWVDSATYEEGRVMTRTYNIGSGDHSEAEQLRNHMEARGWRRVSAVYPPDGGTITITFAKTYYHNDQE